MAAHPLKSKCEKGETPDDTKSLLFLNDMKVRFELQMSKNPLIHIEVITQLLNPFNLKF